MNSVTLRVTCLLLIWGCAGSPSLAGEGRPNILLIMADDMGYSDLGCFGSEIATPNLDRLAARGLLFTHFYNNSLCVPTRASLLTGLYPHRAGRGNNRSIPGNPAYQGHLNDRCVTLAEVLREGGYRTYMSGKWHTGSSRPHWAVDRGFDRYFGLVSGACNYFKLDPGRKMALDGEPYVPTGDFYMTDAFSNFAVSMLEAHDPKDPFFLYVAYTAPHEPLHAPTEDVLKYRGRYLGGWGELRKSRYRRLLERGLVPAQWGLSPRDGDAPAWADAKNKDDWDLRMAIYAAQIDRMDQGIGRILGKLREIGAQDDTLVLFLSDNGACMEDCKDYPGVPGAKNSCESYGLAWANACNTPYRLFKGWLHEGGILTPLIVSWPAVIRQAGVTRQVGHVIDLMATCLDAAGLDYPRTYKGRPISTLDGKSLLPIFRGGKRKGHDVLFWEQQRGMRAARRGKWKLVAREYGDWELYDLESDGTELNDLAANFPDRVKELAAKYDRWAARCGVVPWNGGAK